MVKQAGPALPPRRGTGVGVRIQARNTDLYTVGQKRTWRSGNGKTHDVVVKEVTPTAKQNVRLEYLTDCRCGRDHTQLTTGRRKR